MESNPRLQAAIIEVVNNQLESHDPPETYATFERLVKEGYSSLEAKELIGNVVVAEVFEVMNEGKPFDPQRYITGLSRLPDLPEVDIT
jgi:hypothetical protein